MISSETKKCDICHRLVTDKIVDGKMKIGQWAYMCVQCHKQYGVGLGTGKGQMFDVQSGEKIQG